MNASVMLKRVPSAPPGDCTAQLRALWEKNLGCACNVTDDYFRKGGDSLRAVQLLAWIQRDFSVELSLLDVFSARTLGEQAVLIGERRGRAPGAPPPPQYDFFAAGGASLFFALHRAISPQARLGAVLCYPMGQEFMRIHRTYAELARALSAAGVHALRFDYFGCGDSAGDSWAGDMPRWCSDIRQAVRMLADRTSADSIFLVGARIGANLVLSIAAAEAQVRGIVLWEPVLDGPEYLRTLQRAHHDLLAFNAMLTGYESRSLPTGCSAEALGFPITRDLQEQLASINLTRTPLPANLPQALVLANSDKAALRAFAAARSNGHAAMQYVASGASDAIWLKEDRQNKGVVPVEAVRAIVSWITARSA